KLRAVDFRQQRARVAAISAEKAAKYLLRHLALELGNRAQPRRAIDHLRVDQEAIHVEDDRARGRALRSAHGLRWAFSPSSINFQNDFASPSCSSSASGRFERNKKSISVFRCRMR